MPPVARFAPSPTGLLHLGNARIAVVNWLFARKEGGRFLLRIDDTDRERSEEAYVEAIREDLRWLGLGWQAELRQSERAGSHAAAFARLAESGAVYPCYETPEELAALRARQRAAGLPPRYDRQALSLSPAEQAGLEAAGRRPHWRLRLPDREIAFSDLILGPRRFPPTALSDPVIRREDGSPTYLFASAVDDAELGITHVIRGEDHVTNTALQLAILEALGAVPPRFAHLPLVLDAAGRGLSKREGALSLRALRQAGIEPRAILLALAALGTGSAPDPAHGLPELLESFSLEAYGKAPPRLAVEELPRLSAAVLHRMPFAEARPRLEALGLPGVTAAFWETVRGNLDRLEDAKTWWEVCRGPLDPIVTDPELLRAAAELLPADLAEETAFDRWAEALKARTGKRGRALFRPLRLALTGREHGPELKHLLPQLGRERALARLRGETA